MWHNTRRGRNLIRKRYTTRKFRLTIANVCVILASVFVIAAASVAILKNIGDININIAYKPEVSHKEDISIETNNKIEIYEEPKVELAKKEFNLAALGEIMMGGNINKELEYNYMLAFKHISCS